MGKVIATVGVVVGAVALAATGIGAIAAPALMGSVSLFGVSASTLLLAGTALQAVGQALIKRPETSPSTMDRLNASLVTDTPRKIAFGRTALNTDLRYQEWWGANQEYCSQVFVVASHWCESIDEVWLDDKLAWSSAGGVTAPFAGYLVVQSRPQATSGSAFNAGWSGRWGTNAAFAGCATLYLQFKVTGNGKKATSPFASSITSRVTVIGRGARLPDPRFDSTAGGSGALRVADQSTWAWAPQGYEVGRNPALELLFYLLGWRIQNPQTGVWTLAVGRGIPADRIDLDSFITAANLCDEPVTRSDGSIEPRYRGDGTFSEGDDPAQVIAGFEACMNAKLRDSTGRFSLQILHNDLATPVVDFTDDDVLGDFTWTAGNNLNDRKNLVRGRYVDPSALYQLVDFPAVRLASLDGIDRIDSVDLGLVQSPSQAQRLAKQRLQRMQYPGAFGAEFNARGWAVKDGDIVRLTFAALGFDRKLFRVAEGLIDPTGVVPLVLVEEHPDIYAWDRSETAAVQAAAPNRFDPLLLPLVQAIDDAGRTAEWPAIVGEGKPEDYATNSADPNSPFGDGTVAEAVAELKRIEPIERRADDIESDISAIRDAQQDPETGLDALNEAIRDGISALERVNVGTHAALDALYRADADQTASLRQADRDRLDLTAALATALSEADRTRGLFRDAGFYQDAATGKVGMYAVDQQGEQLARTEITLEAQAALITTKASFNQVNEAIALAVLDPVQAAELRPLIARLASAEQVLDGLNAAIQQTASLAQLNGVAGRVTTAEQGLDAVRGAVATKVERTDFDLLGAKVGGVEETLESLGDVSRYAIDIRQARTNYVDGAASSIASLILGDQNKRQLIVAQATARQEMFAKVDDARAAEAGARAVLTIQLADLDARSVQETKLRIAGEDLLGQRIDALGIANADQSAEIATLTEATIAGKVGLAGITTTVRQQGAAGLGDTVAAIADLVASDQAGRRRDGQIAQFQSDVSTRFVANEVAAAMAQQALLARMGGFDAALVTTLKVVADNDKAAGSRLFALETALANPLTGLSATRVRINAVEEASTTRDEALGERINSVEAVIFAPDTGLPAALALITRNEAARVSMDNVLAEDIAALGVVQQGQAATIANLSRASIENGVGIAGVTTTIRQAIDDGTDSAFTALANLVAGDQAGQRFYRQLAEYQADTTTTLVANESAAVVARQAMLVRMAGFEAALVTTNKVIADTEKSLVSRIVAAEAVFNNPTTGLPATRSRLIAFEESTATAIEAQGERMDLMDATLLDPRTGKTLTGASVARDVKIAADANASRITDIEQLRGEVFNPDSGLPAVSGRIDREAELSLTRDSGLGIEISELAVEVHDPDTGLVAAHAGIAAERKASVDRDNANAASIQQVTSRLDGVGGVGVEQSIETVVDRLGVIEGRYTVTIDANGNLTGFQLIGSDEGPGTFNLINTDLRMGTGRIVLNTGTFMQVMGLGFGKNADLVEWFGPTMAITACTRANAVSYKTITGDAYFGGSLSAGIIKNAVQTTSNGGPGLQLTTGEVGSNGRPRQVILSYAFSRMATQTSFQGVDQGQSSATVTLAANGVTIATLNASGDWRRTAYQGNANPARYEETVSGSLTMTDRSGGTKVTYTATLTTRSLGPGPSGTPTEDSVGQIISIIETED